MDTLQISKFATFVVALQITRNEVFYSNIKLQDLSLGYRAKATLYSSKQVLVNSSSEEINIENISFEKNCIIIPIPTNILLDNTFYLGDVVLYNDDLTYKIFSFQLNINEFNTQKSLMFKKTIVLNDTTYELLSLNSFNNRE